MLDISKIIKNQNFKNLLDIEVELKVRVGTKTLLLNDILNIDTGSILDLNESVEEDVDILINDKKIASGQIIETPNQKFGIKITKLEENRLF